MTPAWTGHALLRTVVYLYFAVGAGLIASGVIFAIWLDFGGSANTYPSTFAWLAFLAILLALLATTRGQLGRPISLRKWIPLCLFASIGLLPVVLLFGATSTSA
jgi:hypothetical protein